MVKRNFSWKEKDSVVKEMMNWARMEERYSRCNNLLKDHHLFDILRINFSQKNLKRMRDGSTIRKEKAIKLHKGLCISREIKAWFEALLNPQILTFQQIISHLSPHITHSNHPRCSITQEKLLLLPYQTIMMKMIDEHHHGETLNHPLKWKAHHIVLLTLPTNMQSYKMISIFENEGMIEW